MLDAAAIPHRRRGADRLATLGVAEVGPRVAVAYMSVLVVVVVALGLVHLGAKPLSLDSSDSLRYATTPGIAGIGENGGDMVLYYLLLKGVVMLFGRSPFVVRLPSVVFGAAALPVVEELGRRVWNQRVGLVSATLFGVSLPLVAWEHAGRGYTLGTFLVSTGVLAWIMLARRPGLIRAAVFVALATLATYSLLLNWWVLVGEFVVLASWFAARKRRGSALARPARWWLGGSLAVVGIWTAQLALIALSTGTARFEPRLNQVTPARIAHTLMFLASTENGGTSAPPWDVAAVLLTLATVVLCLAGLWRSSPGVGEPVEPDLRRFAVATLVLWLVLPAIGQVGVSLLVHPMYQYRYFLMCLPAAALLTAAGLERLRRIGVLPYAATLLAVIGAHAAFLKLPF